MPCVEGVTQMKIITDVLFHLHLVVMNNFDHFQSCINEDVSINNIIATLIYPWTELVVKSVWYTRLHGFVLKSVQGGIW